LPVLDAESLNRCQAAGEFAIAVLDFELVAVLIDMQGGILLVCVFDRHTARLRSFNSSHGEYSMETGVLQKRLDGEGLAWLMDEA
jgi:hypothetical protein